MGAADDEAFYEMVAQEVAEGRLRPGLWAKAFSQANGDEKAARAIYIRLRVEQLTDTAIRSHKEFKRDQREANRRERETEREELRRARAALKLKDPRDRWEAFGGGTTALMLATLSGLTLVFFGFGMLGLPLELAIFFTVVIIGAAAAWGLSR